MGLRVVDYDGKCLTLSAPLSNNINHQLSAFGGSQFSIAALAGWGLLELKMSELGVEADIVIAGGDVSYRAPVLEDFTCRCELPESWPAFVDRFSSRGKASVVLTPTVFVQDEAAMELTGTYVVIRRESGSQ